LKNTIADNKRFTKPLIAKLPNWRYFFEILAKLGVAASPLDATAALPRKWVSGGAPTLPWQTIALPRGVTCLG
jgi:hypothetical protein